MSSIYPYYQMISGIDRSYERSAKSSIRWISWSIGWLETLPLLGKIVELIDRYAEQVLIKNQEIPECQRSFSWLTKTLTNHFASRIFTSDEFLKAMDKGYKLPNSVIVLGDLDLTSGPMLKHTCQKSSIY
ncbi:MAG: hypothetical protein H7A38_03500 [Chlamydiales bacterium]|nr:hypothetical protein [Chlamydiales bacterium]